MNTPDKQTAIHGQCLSASSTHDFEVTNYPALDGMDVGEFVSSPIFDVGGYSWTIRFYPNGWKEDTVRLGYASVCLEYHNKEKDVRTKFSMNLLDKHGKIQVTNYDVTDRIVSPERDCLGISKFVQKFKLKSLSSLNDGSFTIRCALTVIRIPRAEDTRNIVVVPEPNLHVHLEGMLKEGEGGDVTFNVSGQLFQAHRCVLAARSPFFRAELFGQMKERTAECIKVKDIDPSIFEALLHFLYTDSIPKDFEKRNVANIQHLLVAADRYGVDRLRAICESKLCEIIDVETVATTLVLAYQHHCMQLHEACIEFVATRDVLGVVMETDGFKHLSASCPHLLEEILRKVYRLWNE